MADHPILFNSDMACAIRDGRKTQTRRLIPGEIHINSTHTSFHWHKPRGGYMERHDQRGNDRVFRNILGDHCPYGVPGDLLWVREPFRISQVNVLQNIVHGTYTRDSFDFVCDFPDQDIAKYEKWKKPYSGKSSLFMFKSLIRFWLKVKSVRVERLKEISEVDALAEGVLMGSSAMGHTFTAKENFVALWDSIYAKRGYGWDVNPYVWVTEFERYSK